MRTVGGLQPPTGPSRVIAPSGFYVLLQEAVVCPVANRPLQLLPMVFRLPEDKRIFLRPMALREPMRPDLPFVDCQSMLLPVARPSYSGTTSHGFWLARPARGCATGE